MWGTGQCILKERVYRGKIKILSRRIYLPLRGLKNTIVNGDRYAVIVERKPFSGASMEALINCTLLLVGGIVLVIVSIIDVDNPQIFILFTILIGFIGIVESSVTRDRATQSTFEINASGVKHNVKGRMVKEIAWGLDITMDVRTNNGRRNDTHGPLAGYTIYKEDNGSIEFDPRDGWPMEGIRRVWEPLRRTSRWTRGWWNTWKADPRKGWTVRAFLVHMRSEKNEGRALR